MRDGPQRLQADRGKAGHAGFPSCNGTPLTKSLAASERALPTYDGKLKKEKTIMDWGLRFFFDLMIGLCRIIWAIGVKLRLGVCMVYMLVVYLFFWKWYCANTALADGILIALVVLTAISWIATLVLKIKKWRMLKRADEANRQYLETMK